MSKVLSSTAVALGLSLAAPTTPLQAAPVCPFGRTLAGDCITQTTAQLAKWAQTAGRVYTQDRISATSALVLPSQDRVYPRSYDFYFLRSGQN